MQACIKFLKHPPLFLAVRRSSHFCEMVVNFYAVLSKRGRFSKAPYLKTSCFPCRGPRVSTINFLFGLQYFDFFIRRSKTADLLRNLIYIILGTKSILGLNKINKMYEDPQDHQVAGASNNAGLIQAIDKESVHRICSGQVILR